MHTGADHFGHTGAPEQFILSVEEGHGCVIVLTRVASDKEPELRYLSRRRYFDSYPSEVLGGVLSALELSTPWVA
jgi:hypothetical protein